MHTPSTTYLKDYAPPDFLIETVDLRFELNAEKTRVISQLNIRQNPALTQPTTTLELAGEALKLKSVRLDGRTLDPHEYEVSEESLRLANMPQQFELQIETCISPESNTALEGLYLSNGLFCTQCEAEGFRKITYFLDRPDVMARYTTILVADKSDYPVLLSNGNRVDQGELNHNRHWVKWEDPFKKPCYLFALVAGKLDCINDTFTTLSGRDIQLQVYVEAQDSDKCEHAIQSLKHAMAWDERVYGREYDLDLYMIVAVSHFNMGAMENKGLNIFNTKFVLARPDTATDSDYAQIEGVIAHEYFHNWTGNRITCRDWFQLSLKEGLTVFRDQAFSADQTSQAVKRIEDVNMLRTRQFPEDAGPMAHPILPESYIEINNFYTLTVYEKGAEVVRMLQTLLGVSGFHQGMDLYFQRHDGQAVTTDDFVQAMEDANKLDLSQFRLWYTQAGTPELSAHSEYDSLNKRLKLTIFQHCPDTPQQRNKQSFHIPLRIGLLDSQGNDLPIEQPVLQLTESEQSFCFEDIASQPVVSLLRGFSAPVKLHITRDLDELIFLFQHDTDTFNRWEAGQQLISRIILQQAEQYQQKLEFNSLEPRVRDAFLSVFEQAEDDFAYASLLLTLPGEAYLGEQMEVVDVEAIHAARQHIKLQLASTLQPEFKFHYQYLQNSEAGLINTQAMGQRKFKNICLTYLTTLDNFDGHVLSKQQFDYARTMTDQIAALSTIVNSQNPHRTHCLDSFYQQWQQEALVIDKWFVLQAMCQLPDTLDTVIQLVKHPAFSLKNPNRVRSLIGAFCQSNPLRFHTPSGAGYQFLADQVIILNKLNPQVASRMLSPFTQWHRYPLQQQQQIIVQLERITALKDVSKDVYEIASKSIRANQMKRKVT